MTHRLSSLVLMFVLAGCSTQNLAGAKVTADVLRVKDALDALKSGDGKASEAGAPAAAAPAAGVASVPAAGAGSAAAAGVAAAPAAGVAAAPTAAAAVASGVTGTGAAPAAGAVAAGAAGNAVVKPAEAVPAVPAPVVAAVAAVAPAVPPIFADDFSGGQLRWQVVSPAGTATDGKNAQAWNVVDSEGQEGAPSKVLALTEPGPLTATRRTFYIATKDVIDLAGAESPRLKLTVKDPDAAGASFKAVWQSADAGHPQETLLGAGFTADPNWSQKEFDLSALQGQAGHLIVVARAEQGALPMLDDVTVYDAK